MKTDYFGHDAAYKKRRASKQAGWNTEEGYEKSFAYIERTLQADHVPKTGKLLEMGCGAGNISLRLADRGYEVHGLDIAPTAIEWAQEQARERKLEIDFRVGDVLDLKDYADESFDFVLDGHCLHCIIGDDRKLFLASAFRVLKPQGFFHVRTMCGQAIAKDLQENFDVKSRCLILGGIATRYIGLPEDILDEIRAAGFEIVHREWEEEPPLDEDEQLTILVDAIRP